METITGLKKSRGARSQYGGAGRKGIVSASGSLIAIREKRPVTIRQEFKTGKKALITSSPIYNEKGEIVMVVTNVRDLTELYSPERRSREDEAGGNASEKGAEPYV